jgi:thiol-disulfide isomerase/thioredoxin
MTLSEIQTELEARRNAGRPVLLNFWATWCGPCIEELPDLSVLSREFGDDGPELIGLSLDTWVFSSEAEAEERVRAALKRAGVSYVNLIHRGEQDPLLESFDLPGPLPYSVLYDGEGREVTSWNGKVVLEQLRRAASKLE